MTTLTVYVALAVFNFVGSIIQGVAGIGDAIFLQVLWYMAYTADPQQFGDTPLGADPVGAVALLMYIRLLFMSPLVVYLGLSDSIFSKQMTIMMAIPSTILTIIGVYLFKLLDGKGSVLKLILGISSFAFALMYLCILVLRFFKKKKNVEALKGKNVKVVVEADAIQEEANMDLSQSFNSLQASFVNRVPNSSILIMQPPAGYAGSGRNAVVGGRGEEPIGFDTVPVDAHSPTLDPETGLPIGTTEAFVSTVEGQPFVAAEAAVPQATEDNVPQLTPSKLSPSRTMTFTRVRINRNLDANGKIKMKTKIGAAIAASAAGLMASLTGVNAPPQIIFILLFDAPNYIVRVNFSAQSIPSNIIRFFMAIGLGKFSSSQIPIYIVTVIFGYMGVFAGNAIGRLLGPTSFNVFVLCLLLLSSLVMVANSVLFLALCTLATCVITVVVAVWERRKNAEVIEKQTEAEMEIEKRMYDVMEELQRNNNSFIPPSSVDEQMFQRRQEAQRPKPMWSGLDNDDDTAPPRSTPSLSHESSQVVPAPKQPPTAHREGADGAANEDSASAKDSLHTLRTTVGDSTVSRSTRPQGHASRDYEDDHEDAERDAQTVPHPTGGVDDSDQDVDSTRRNHRENTADDDLR